MIVLPDSSLFRRQRKQHQEEGKSVPETTIADMRGVWTRCCAYRKFVEVFLQVVMHLVSCGQANTIGNDLFA